MLTTLNINSFLTISILDWGLFENCHNPNSTSTQPQLNSTELGLTWLLLFTTTPPSHRELYFHRKRHQINLWFCLNNNINSKDNKNNKNNDNKDNNNKTTTKQLGCDIIVISLVSFSFISRCFVITITFFLWTRYLLSSVITFLESCKLVD